MTLPRLVLSTACAIALAGCVTGVHREAAAHRMPAPREQTTVAVAGMPASAYPSIGGDILKGTSPADLAASRAAASAALTQALEHP